MDLHDPFIALFDPDGRAGLDHIDDRRQQCRDRRYHSEKHDSQSSFTRSGDLDDLVSGRDGDREDLRVQTAHGESGQPRTQHPARHRQVGSRVEP